MTTERTARLHDLLDRFGREHWNDAFAPGRADLSIDGRRLFCTKGGETIAGDAAAPLLFAAGAWALIFAQECDGRFGDRVDGRVNRVWPNGPAARSSSTGWARRWPPGPRHGRT